MDLGTGFLPGGKIYEERERAKQRLSLDGQFLTPGRLIARTMVEPGSTEYQVLSGLGDAALDLYADPTAAGLKAVSRGAQAARTFQAPGVLAGIRKTVDPAGAVNHFLGTNPGRGLVRFLTENRDVETAWRAIGQADLSLARRLANTTSETETFEILRDTLGTVIRERPTASFVNRGAGTTLGFLLGGRGGAQYGRLFGGGAVVKRAATNNRLLRTVTIDGRLLIDLPDHYLDVNDVNQAAKSLDRWMRTARFSDEMRKARLAELSELADGDNVGLFHVKRRVMDDTEGLLVTEWGMRRSEARKITQLWGNVADDLRAFDVDDMGRHVDVLAPLRVNVAGETIDVSPTPGLIAELVDGHDPPARRPRAAPQRLPVPTAQQFRAGPGDTGVRRRYQPGLEDSPTRPPRLPGPCPVRGTGQDRRVGPRFAVPASGVGDRLAVVRRPVLEAGEAAR